MYQLELEHHGLNQHRLISGRDRGVVQAKASLQVLKWSEMWERKEDQSARARDRQQSATNKAQQKQYIEDRKAEAVRRTQDAKAALDSLRGTLAATLGVDDTIRWDELKTPQPFPAPRPRPRAKPSHPASVSVTPPPKADHPTFRAQLGFLDRLIGSRRVAKEAAAASRLADAQRIWEAERAQVEAAHAERTRAWEKAVALVEAEDAAALRGWEAERSAHQETDAERQRSIDALRARFEAKDSDAVEEYCDMVLAASSYPESFPKEWEFEFNGDTGILIVNYVLPAPDDLPSLTDVKYVQADDSFAEKHLTDAQRAKLYDEVLYQVTLRSIHELFEADQPGALTAVAFNGVVTAIDRGSGNAVTNCVLSVQASRAPFLAINLAQVDPKACFRSLKGVGSSSLHSVTAVPPVLTMRRDDGRFISERDVAHMLSAGYNLATMAWEDFEHLIREVFAKEFSAGGGEVRVTQASRDGGVDAVAFDPDPIRGGKLVIQAKRYANTVGVSAVRDLYGTMMNEGATKGILVTTSDYGPDAYEFAKGKPLALLNGGNLLHLLEKHGLKAHINLVEAKQDAMRRSSWNST